MSLIILSPSGDTTGGDDTAALNANLASGTDTVLEMLPGDWYTNAEVVIPDGACLQGYKGGVNGATSTGPQGTVIHPTADFGGSCVLSLVGPQKGNLIRDLAILNDLLTPANVDGIACRGDIGGLRLEGLSIANVTGHGVAFYQISGADGDGLKMRTVMIQRPGKNGVHRPTNDANIHDVHVQYAGNIDGVGSAFWSSPNSSGNMHYVACRADLSYGYGWVIDHKGSYGDATKLTGCSTERNSKSGVLVTNSSGTGQDWRAPVQLTGCCFEGDGTGIPAAGQPAVGGEYAGVQIQGRNRVYMDGTLVVVSKTDLPATCPKYSVALNQVGSAPGECTVLAINGGHLNYSSLQGGRAILNHSLCDNLLIDPTVTQSGGYESDTVYRRSGVALLSGGSVTVPTPWMLGSGVLDSNVLLTPYNNFAGKLYVSARSTGSFTIKSSVATDVGTVAWLIV
jgi:hypothetical protein